MEQCALELGTLWGAATVDENFASINPSSPITCLSRWSKNPFGEAKWAFYVPPLKLEDTRAHMHELRRRKWEVSVSLRALTLISRQRNTLPPFYFYQDHLRIDQVPALLWHRLKKRINLDILFIYFPPSVCWIIGCFHKRLSYEPEQYWRKVTSRFCQTKRLRRKLNLARRLTRVHIHSGSSRNSIMIFHIFYFPSLSPVVSLPPPFHHHLSPHLRIWHHIYCSSPPSTAVGSLVEHPLNSAESLLPRSSLLTFGCLSLRQRRSRSICQ